MKPDRLEGKVVKEAMATRAPLEGMGLGATSEVREILDLLGSREAMAEREIKEIEVGLPIRV